MGSGVICTNLTMKILLFEFSFPISKFGVVINYDAGNSWSELYLTLTIVLYEISKCP